MAFRDQITFHLLNTSSVFRSPVYLALQKSFQEFSKVACTDRKVCHRDLKLENILVTEKNNR